MRSILLLGSLGLLAGCPKAELDQMIQGYGYTNLVPPSTLMPPGTIVYRKQTNPLQAGILCEAKSAIGSDPITVESSTTDLVRSLQKKSSFSLGLDALEVLGAKADLKHVKSVTMSLKNAKVIELPRAKVLEALDSHRSDYCADAILMYLQKEEAISMIVSVLQADVVYTVEIDKSAGLNAEATHSIVEGISGALGASGGKVSGTTIEGVGLYWGVQDELELAVHGLPGAKGVVGEALPPQTLADIDAAPVAEALERAASERVMKPELEEVEAETGDTSGGR